MKGKIVKHKGVNRESGTIVINNFKTQKEYVEKIEVFHEWYINQESNEIKNAISTLKILIKNNAN